MRVFYRDKNVIVLAGFHNAFFIYIVKIELKGLSDQALEKLFASLSFPYSLRYIVNT